LELGKEAIVDLRAQKVRVSTVDLFCRECFGDLFPAHEELCEASSAVGLSRYDVRASRVRRGPYGPPQLRNFFFEVAAPTSPTLTKEKLRRTKGLVPEAVRPR
jgi:hypothetical protein